MKTLESIITDPQVFLDDLFSLIEKSKIDVSEYFLDHICYRVGSDSEYQTKKSELAQHG
ncbi:MAG: VOC family protein, partial [Bdellovibrionales bacterium]|nr:VOC family protein [Bdellovibrionales bacterium]